MPYRIPDTTVKLGEVVDLVTVDGEYQTQWGGDVEGFQLLTNPDAMERSPGGARLFLVLGKLSAEPPEEYNPGTKEADQAAETWERWHRRHGPDFTGGIDNLPDEVAVPIGRATALTYRSDKWNPRGKKGDWIHDFTEGQPPLVYVDDPKNPRAFVLVGGDICVTERGIE